MRSLFTERLAAIDQAAADTAQRIATAIDTATRAILAGDLALAESVIVEDARIKLSTKHIAEQILAVVARQQPVAYDARHLIAILRLTAALEAMADSAVGLAKIARSRYPDAAAPPIVRGVVVDMGNVALQMSATVAADLTASAEPPSAEIAALCQKMRQLNAEMTSIIRSGAWPYSVETAADVTGICHHYSRFAEASRSADSILIRQ